MTAIIAYWLLVGSHCARRCAGADQRRAGRGPHRSRRGRGQNELRHRACRPAGGSRFRAPKSPASIPRSEFEARIRRAGPHIARHDRGALEIVRVVPRASSSAICRSSTSRGFSSSIPNHPEARTLLGFRKAGGQWMTRDAVMAARGMVKYEGRYVTRQHVELLERQKKSKSSQADWNKELDRLRRWLTGRRADRAARGPRRNPGDPRPDGGRRTSSTLIRRENDPELKTALDRGGRRSSTVSSRSRR